MNMTRRPNQVLGRLPRKPKRDFYPPIQPARHVGELRVARNLSAIGAAGTATGRPSRRKSSSAKREHARVGPFWPDFGKLIDEPVFAFTRMVLRQRASASRVEHEMPAWQGVKRWRVARFPTESQNRLDVGLLGLGRDPLFCGPVKMA